MKTTSILIVFAASIAIAASRALSATDSSELGNVERWNGLNDDYPYGSYRALDEYGSPPQRQKTGCSNAANTYSGQHISNIKANRRKQDNRRHQDYHDTFLHFHKHGIEHFYPPIAVLGG